MTNQTTACRTTRHCAEHGFCHRCMPSLDDATQHLVKAIDAAGIEYPASGRLYAKLATGVRDAARQATKACRCPHPADEHSVYGCADDCACEWMPRRAARQAALPLSTPCASCRHNLSWHTPGKRCQVRAGENRCGCRAFVTPAARQATAQPADECPQCDDTGACNGGPCAHPAAGQQPSDTAIDTAQHPAAGQPAADRHEDRRDCPTWGPVAAPGSALCSYECRCQDPTPAVGRQDATQPTTDETETDVTWSVVFRTDTGDTWQEWSKGWRDTADAVRSGETVASIATVAEVRFVRTTTTRERFSLHQLAAGAES